MGGWSYRLHAGHACARLDASGVCATCAVRGRKLHRALLHRRRAPTKAAWRSVLQTVETGREPQRPLTEGQGNWDLCMLARRERVLQTTETGREPQRPLIKNCVCAGPGGA